MYHKPHDVLLIRRCFTRCLSVRRSAQRRLTSVLLILLVVVSAPKVGGQTNKANQWLNDLRSTDTTIRTRTAYAYSNLEPATKTTVLLLLEGLKDRNPYVRRYCASALGEIGIEPGLAVPALMEALKDPDQNVREHVSIALVKIGSPAVPSLIETLKNEDIALSRLSLTEADKATGSAFEDDEDVTPLGYYAVFALKEIGVPAVPQLMDASVSTTENLRILADYILDQIAHADESDPTRFLNNPDRRVRLWAAISLASPRHYERVGFGPLRDISFPRVKTELILAPLLKELKGDDKIFQAKALRALGLIRAEAVPGVPTLIKFLRDSNDEVRSEAVVILGNIGPAASHSIPQLIIMLNDPSPQVRRDIVDALRGSENDSPTVINALIASLSDSDSTVQERAMFGLAMFGIRAKAAAPVLAKVAKARFADRAGQTDYNPYLLKRLFQGIGPASVPPILELLKDDNEHLRLYAIEILDHEYLKPRDPGTIGAITPLLQDTSKKVRIKATRFLARVAGVKSGIPILIELLKDPDPDVRRDAAVALQDAREPATVPALIEALKDERPEVRQAAISTLQGLGNNSPSVVGALMAALTDSDRGVRGEAVSAVMRVADPKSNPAIATELIPLLVKSIQIGAKDPEASFWRFFEALETFGPRAIPALLELAKSDNEVVSRYAFDVLGDLAPQHWRAGWEIISLVNDPRVHVRRNAVKALGEFMSESAISALTKSLDDPAAEVRLAVLKVFQGVEQSTLTSVVPHIAKLLNDPEIDVRVAAIRILFKTNSDKLAAVRRLAGELHISNRRPTADGKSYEGNPALPALTEIGEDSVPTLITSLRDSNVIVRQNASMVLKDLGPRAKAAIPELIVSLADSDPEVRLNAAYAIQKLGRDAKDAGPPLLALLEDPNDELRSAAANALFAIDFDLSRLGGAFNTIVNDNFVHWTMHKALSRMRSEIYGFSRKYPRGFPGAMAAYSESALYVRSRSGVHKVDLPQFPWPPPRFSGQYVLPRSSLGNDANTLDDINNRLTSALANAGYDVRAFFNVENGFAIVTKVERIFDDGSSHPLPHRWTKGKVSPDSIKGFLSELFFERPGQFRMFVFVLTDVNTIRARAAKLTEDEARGLSSTGSGILPDTVGRLPFRGRNCQVLVYRFQKKFGQGATIEYDDPLGLSAEKHLRGSGLLRWLGL